MARYELGFKLQRESPYDELSKRHPSMTMAMWCNYEKDVLEITYGDQKNFDKLQKDLQRLTKVLGARLIRKAFTKSNVQLVTQHCGCANIRYRVSPVIEKHNCLEIQPMIYNKGWEWRRVIAFSQRDIKALFKELDVFCKIEIISRQTVEVGSIRDAFLISTADLLGGLTKKQIQALVQALESGYYSVPKKTTAKEIANRIGLPRTTFEEHLRKAESKVLQAVAPFAHFSS